MGLWRDNYKIILTLIKKIHIQASKCTVDINIKSKTIKHLKENIRENLCVTLG